MLEGQQSRALAEILAADAASSRISRRRRILRFALLPLVAVAAGSIARGAPSTAVQRLHGAQLVQADQPARPETGGPDRENRVDADLAALKLGTILPGWVKLPGRSSRAVFNVVRKPQSTRFEDIGIDGGGVLIKGSLEVDRNGDLVAANFPVYSPSDGDNTTLEAERSPDGALKLTMRGEIFDGRDLLKSAASGPKADASSEPNTVDLDVDLRLARVTGFGGETVRDVDIKLSRRNGTIRNFALRAKLGPDTPLTADLRSGPQGRDVVYLKTNDAGAFLRFTDIYAKVIGGQLALAVEPPTVEPRAQEGLINIRDFSVKGEAALDRVAAGGPVAS